MSRLAFLARRTAGLVVSVWVVFTLSFLYIAFTPFTEGTLASERVGVSPLDPLTTQYVDWLAWLVTIWDDPVVATMLDHLAFTAVYLVPSVAFAVVAGVGIRVYSVGREGARVDTYVSAFTLLAVSLPVFLVALFLRYTFMVPFFEALGTVRIYDRSVGPFATRNLLAAVWPVAAMGLYLFAVQLRYAGDLLQEYAGADFVKTARAKGGSSVQVGRHIFRNTAIPLLTVFFTDMLGMVVVGVFLVEYIVGIPGLGELTIEAVLQQNFPLIVSLAVLTVLVGVLANFAQDVAYTLFDPRVEFGE